jgi:glycosyltransferase involved in cell wall biosynthesis
LLKARSNVHVLGPRPYRDLPLYQAQMDVNTLTYRTDPGGWWTDLSPLKLYEYLAVGRPVVGASLEVLQRLGHVVAIAKSPQDWLMTLEAAIKHGGVGSPSDRRAEALANGWDAIVDRLDAWLLPLAIPS